MKTVAKKSAKKSVKKKSPTKQAAKKTSKPLQKRDKQPFRAGLKAFFHPDIQDTPAVQAENRPEDLAMAQKSRESQDERNAYQLNHAPVLRRQAHDGSGTRRSQGAQLKK